MRLLSLFPFLLAGVIAEQRDDYEVEMANLETGLRSMMTAMENLNERRYLSGNSSNATTTTTTTTTTTVGPKKTMTTTVPLTITLPATVLSAMNADVTKKNAFLGSVASGVGEALCAGMTSIYSAVGYCHPDTDVAGEAGCKDNAATGTVVSHKVCSTMSRRRLSNRDDVRRLSTSDVSISSTSEVVDAPAAAVDTLAGSGASSLATTTSAASVQSAVITSVNNNKAAAGISTDLTTSDVPTTAISVSATASSSGGSQSGAAKLVSTLIAGAGLAAAFIVM